MACGARLVERRDQEGGFCFRAARVLPRLWGDASRARRAAKELRERAPCTISPQRGPNRRSRTDELAQRRVGEGLVLFSAPRRGYGLGAVLEILLRQLASLRGRAHLLRV